MKRKLGQIGFILLWTLLIGVGGTAAAEKANGYLNIAWGSSFPQIEQQLKELEFVEEDDYHTTIFTGQIPHGEATRRDLKLFENQLYSAVHYFDRSLSGVMNESYIKKNVGNLGTRLEVRKNQTHELLGTTKVTIWEYPDVIVLFKEYPTLKETSAGKAENSITFVYKKLFKQMLAFRKKGEPDTGDSFDVDDPDYIAY